MYYIHTSDEQEYFLNNIDYIKISSTSGCYVLSTEQEAQGIVINSVPYSISNENPLPDIQTAVIVDSNEWNEDIHNKYDSMLCSGAKSIKIPELSNACNEAINAGTTIQFSNGPSEMFTYNIDDQANISEMTNAMIMGATSYPYHASGDDCRMYSKDEIVQIYSTLSALKTHHLTYYNQLRAYVNSLTSAEDVYNVQYGQELTGIYLDTYNTLMQQALVEMNNVVEKMKNETTNS